MKILIKFIESELMIWNARHCLGRYYDEEFTTMVYNIINDLIEVYCVEWETYEKGDTKIINGEFEVGDIVTPEILYKIQKVLLEKEQVDLKRLECVVDFV